MNFFDFINEYVDDDAFKKTIKSLHDVWVKSEKHGQFESAVTVQPQTSVSTANTPEQNAAAAAQTQQGQQQVQQQGQQKVEPRTIQGDLNNLNSQQAMSLAARFQEIEKQKAENDKAAAQAQEKLNTELDDLQKNFNAVANGKTNNIVG
jgi:hypothetical protein